MLLIEFLNNLGIKKKEEEEERHQLNNICWHHKPILRGIFNTDKLYNLISLNVSLEGNLAISSYMVIKLEVGNCIR